MRGAFFEAALLVAAALVAVASASICRQGQTWWSPEKDTCLNCTDCNSQKTILVVLRPCQVHQDTVCAPLADLHLDWSWLSNGRRHAKHRKDRNKKKQQETDQHNESAKVNKQRKIIWHFSTLSDENVGDVKYEKIAQNDKTSRTEVTKDINELIIDNAEIDEEEDLPDAGSQHLEEYTDYDSELEVRLEREPLVSEDDFVWDWQTVVLTMAAFACILFFMVVAVYSVYHARQWRILKENLEADVEGLSAKINLMMASAETNDLPEPPSTGVENHYSNNCAYLEQLLVGKGKGRTSGPGNVYIQESNTF